MEISFHLKCELLKYVYRTGHATQIKVNKIPRNAWDSILMKFTTLNSIRFTSDSIP